MEVISYLRLYRISSLQLDIKRQVPIIYISYFVLLEFLFFSIERRGFQLI